MKVFKFGGASVKDAVAIRNVSQILSSYDDQLIVVISAMGKTTNAIEQVILHVYDKNTEAAINAWKVVCHQHREVAIELQAEDHSLHYLKEYEDEGIDTIYNYPAADKDEFYDQLISLGELMSTTIVAAYLLSQGIGAKWVDARKLIMTDAHFRSANIQWRETEARIKEHLDMKEIDEKFVITQGFIGRSRDGRTTTLGREGSDYSAAIISYCIDAESMEIWKDVPGVLTADPRIFSDAILIPQLSYKEAIEMTYYGAQVIHPKTIQPIQRKGIPLHVNSFIHPENKGTVIKEVGDIAYPPMIVVTKNQHLLQFSTKDFSFIAESHLSMLFRKFAHFRIRINLMRNSAISFIVSVSAEEDRLAELKEDLSYEFVIQDEGGLELITVRHYNMEIIADLKKGKVLIFEEVQGETFQMVVKQG